MSRKNEKEHESIEEQNSLGYSFSESSDEPISQQLLKNPIGTGFKPYSLEEESRNIRFLIPWIIAAGLMIIFWAIFQFGLLGSDGREGRLCHYLPPNSVCHFLAGQPPIIPSSR